jgi:RHS repeat-associated protein
MSYHPITTPASPSLASPLFDALCDSIESLTTSFVASVVPTLETTTVTEVALGYHRNQQYSITAITTSTGAVAERYAYTAYGQPTILNASGTVLTSSAVGNRYTYTGREWDETLGLHHFRARWMSPLAGRFLGRDPIGYVDGYNCYQHYFALSKVDPSGLECGEPWFGCITTPIDTDSVKGMPWHSESPIKLKDPNKVAMGITRATPDFSCPCIECCGEWVIEHFQAHTSIKIYIDRDLHRRLREPTRNTYGHEQRHVINIINGLKSTGGACDLTRVTYESVKNSRFRSKVDCQTQCLKLELEFLSQLKKVLDKEDHVPDDHEPFEGLPYTPIGGVMPLDPVS